MANAKTSERAELGRVNQIIVPAAGSLACSGAFWQSCRAVSASAAEPDLEGLWQTPGETPTILRFTQVNGEYRGVIDSIPAAQGEDADLRCTECTGSRRNQPLLNMEIVWGLKRQGREYTGGSVLDPETGAIYRCALTIAPDGQQLRVRYSAEPPLKSMSEIWTRQTRPAASTRDDATSRERRARSPLTNLDRRE